MMSHRLTLATFMGLWTTMAPAETGTFDLSLLGITAGQLTYEGAETDGQYTASGSVRSSRMLKGLVKTEIATKSVGWVSGNTYTPSDFVATERKDGKTIVHRQRYSNGVPTISREPAKSKRNKHAADPASQRGTLDQMTTAYAMLRDRPAALACKLDIALFDGERRHGIQYVRARQEGDKLICDGEYRRLAGFKPEEMNEKPVWKFTVIYVPKGDQMRVHELRIPSKFGNIKMVRR